MYEALERGADIGSFRPRLGDHVELARFASRWHGEHAVIHDRATSTYVRMTGPEADIVNSLDGNRTVSEIVAAALEDRALRPQLVSDVVTSAHRRGFLAQPWVDVYALLEARTAPPTPRWLARAWAWLRTLTIVFPGAPRFVESVYRRGGRHVFHPFAVTAALAVMTTGAATFPLLGPPGDARVLGRPSAAAAAALIALGLAALFVHELGHALAVVHAGRRVLGAGFQLYLGNPAFFIDSSDMVMADRRARAVNAIAGPFAEAVTAGAAALAAAAIGPSPVATVLYRFAAVTFVFMLVNLVPFLELDGYWLMTDLLDVPDLRPRSLAFLRHELPDIVQGRRRATRADLGLGLFGIIGVVFTGVALWLAWVLWAPVATAFGRGVWRAGVVGRVLLVVLIVLALGPVIHGLGDAGRAIVRRARAIRSSVVFRLERRWRVSAGEFLAALPVIEPLEPDDLNELAGLVRRVRVPAGRPLVRQGDAVDAFYVIRRGRCLVTECENGVEHEITRLGPGATFGELALLEGTPRTATVRAETEVEAFAVDAGAFQRLLADALAPPALAPAAWPVTQVWSLPPFRHLDLVGASALATRGTWLRVAPGVCVVEEGEAGEDFYVVASGQLQVERDGTTVGTLRAGDFFGELALLRDAPRAATVRAITPARLFVLPRDAFDAVVRASFEHGSLAAFPDAETHSARKETSP